MRRALPALAALSVALAGCASVKPYPNTAPANLVVRTKMEVGSMTHSAAGLNIHRVESRCKSTYEGLVPLDEPEVRVGLPTEQPLLLSFVFATKAYVGTPGSVSWATMFVARPGHTYTADASYVRGVYDVVLREMVPGGGAGRVLEPRRMPSC